MRTSAPRAHKLVSTLNTRDLVRNSATRSAIFWRCSGTVARAARIDPAGPPPG